MDNLQSLLDSCDIPLLAAFILGLLTALSPCPLATNITAIGFISRDIDNKNRLFVNGLLYTLGRILAYAILGAVLISLLRRGADTFDLQNMIGKWGEWLLSPMMVVIGLLMLFGHQLPVPQWGFKASSRTERLRGAWGSLALGVLFAMAFCPTSGLFYFGMLIPMSATAQGGYLLPVVYAIATGLPVVAVAWILAYSVAGIGSFYKKMNVFQQWFSRIVALLFIVVGIYYGWMMLA